MPYSVERAKEIYDLVEELGVRGTADKLGILTDTVRRAANVHRMDVGESRGDPDQIPSGVLTRITERYSQKELKALADGKLLNAPKSRTIHDFTGDKITFGLLTDTHIGSTSTDPDHLTAALDMFADRGVDFIAHCGDVFEGMSGRPGHVYELTEIGYTAQLEAGVEQFGQWTDTPIYMIDGNHDRWFIKAVGAMIVPELAKALDNVHFLGHDEGDIVLKGTPAKIKLWHGEDGSSYAFSYRIQKIVESFTGGEKPQVLCCGHTHKALYCFDRHIHCVSAGAMQKQSKWMRSKRAASHTGFWVCEMTVNKKGIGTFNQTWYPFYM